MKVDQKSLWLGVALAIIGNGIGTYLFHIFA